MTTSHNRLPLASCEGNKACHCPTSIGQLRNRIANPIPHAPKCQPGGNQIPELPKSREPAPNELAVWHEQATRSARAKPRQSHPAHTNYDNRSDPIAPRSYQFKPTGSPIPTDPSIKETARHEDLLHRGESRGKRSNSQRREELGAEGRSKKGACGGQIPRRVPGEPEVRPAEGDECGRDHGRKRGAKECCPVVSTARTVRGVARPAHHSAPRDVTATRPRRRLTPPPTVRVLRCPGWAGLVSVSKTGYMGLAFPTPTRI
jgi:hypothetical protein